MADSAFFDVEFVQKAIDFAQTRCAMVVAGMDELNPLEQLALQLLCDSAYIERPKQPRPPAKTPASPT